jgi:hypothetical protein
VGFFQDEIRLAVDLQNILYLFRVLRFAPENENAGIAGIGEVAAALEHDEAVNAQLERAAAGKWRVDASKQRTF